MYVSTTREREREHVPCAWLHEVDLERWELLNLFGILLGYFFFGSERPANAETSRKDIVKSVKVQENVTAVYKID